MPELVGRGLADPSARGGLDYEHRPSTSRLLRAEQRSGRGSVKLARQTRRASSPVITTTACHPSYRATAETQLTREISSGHGWDTCCQP